MKKIAFLLIVILVASCSKTKPDLIVKGNIKGLKKGTVYLSKALDSTYQVLDSTVLNGTSNYELKSSIDEPEVLFLSLDANSNKENYISFFANKGTTEINTTLKRFAFDYTVNGCEQQRKLEEFNTVAKKYNNKRLELIKQQFDALSEGNSIKADSIISEAEKNIKRKYLYTINFAINNKNSEVAPYLALSEIYDANITYLDTIYKVLPENIANSKYGKSLEIFIKERKETEATN